MIVDKISRELSRKLSADNQLLCVICYQRIFSGDDILRFTWSKEVKISLNKIDLWLA